MSDARSGATPEERGLAQIASASSGVEADMMCERLAAEGIPAIHQRAIGGPSWGPTGGQYIYVKADQADRARAILDEGAGVSEEELARLSEEAVQGGSEPGAGPDGAA